MRGRARGQLGGIKGILNLSRGVSVRTLLSAPPNVAKTLFHFSPCSLKQANVNMCDAVSTKQAFLDEI